MTKPSYLEQLKQLVSSAFEKAESKEDIDRCSQIEQAIKGVESEQSALMERNKELIASYKEAILHPGVTDKAPDQDVTTVTPSKVTFEDFIASQLK